MPPDGTVGYAVPLTDLRLSLAQEVVQEDFLTILLGQVGEGNGQFFIVQHDRQATGSQEPFFIQFRSHKIMPVGYGIVLFIHQIFKGDFPPSLPLQPSDGADSSMAYDNLAIGIMGTLNSHSIFRFGHGKSPFL